MLVSLINTHKVELTWNPEKNRYHIRFLEFDRVTEHWKVVSQGEVETIDGEATLASIHVWMRRGK